MVIENKVMCWTVRNDTKIGTELFVAMVYDKLLNLLCFENYLKMLWKVYQKST